nr:hypothetical protein [candidate division Zixibacteria bacterium]
MSRKWKVILVLSLALNLTIPYIIIRAAGYRSNVNYFLDKYLKVTSEYSRRDRYVKENQSLYSDSSNPRRVVFLGSQVIENWDMRHYFPDIQALNRGVSGQRFSGFPLRFRPDVTKLKPTAVVIEISSYNFRPETSVEEMEDYMMSMLDMARFNSIKPLPATIIPLREDGLESDEYNFGDYAIMDSLALFNNWLKSYCRSNGIEYIDFNLILSDSTGYLRNDLSRGPIEPNDAGYEVMARAVNEALIKIMNR